MSNEAVERRQFCLDVASRSYHGVVPSEIIGLAQQMLDFIERPVTPDMAQKPGIVRERA
jgi:hypothetical protein